MPRYVGLLIDQANQRFLAVLMWLVAMATVTALAMALGASLITHNLHAEAHKLLEAQGRVMDNTSATLKALHSTAIAEPCSPQFHAQLSAIAYLPDGLNEFLYAPDGVARCSVSADFAPHDFGDADIYDDLSGVTIWYNEPLDFLGLAGLVGDIITRGDFGIVVPPQPQPAVANEWQQVEEVHVLSGGRHVSRSGTPGTYELALAATASAGLLPLHQGAFFALACLPGGRSCVALTAPLFDVLWAYSDLVALAALVCAGIALGISSQAHALLRHFWSFESRFLRHFKPDNILCTYQPILSLATGRISGCEVLVRWRDVDGSTVYPDQFLPLAEARGLGRKLTEYVVRRAYQELSAHTPIGYPLQVNFNIFPRDLDAAWLRNTLQMFEAEGRRFDAVIEIVETEQLQTDQAHREIEALRRFGIKTQLDDFGTGYSNIENLAKLPVAGVKLDRSFAMAAQGSLMAKMLANAIDMVHAAGHRVTVEGVETVERLEMIKATGQVDFIQGYLISRPLDIAHFVLLLDQQDPPAVLRPHIVQRAQAV